MADAAGCDTPTIEAGLTAAVDDAICPELAEVFAVLEAPQAAHSGPTG